jgi:hypothetical protein
MISYIIIIGVLLLGIALDFWLDHRRYKKVMKTVLEETLEVEDSMKKIKKKGETIARRRLVDKIYYISLKQGVLI